MALVEIRNLTKTYTGGDSLFAGAKREVRAVDGVSLDISAGETLGLVGESGSGKSTLGRLVLRLIEPTSGSVRFDGHDLLAASRSSLRQLRRDMQIIFQDPFGSLDPRFRVEDIVAEPLVIHESLSRPARRARAGELLRAVGLDASALPRYPHEFSGGQRQREFRLTYLLISHAMPVVRYLATRIAVMHRGKIVEVGNAEEITLRPQHAYTRTLLASTPELASLEL